MPPTTTIQSLPTEIFSIITAQLPMRDLCNLRLASHHIDHKVHVDFAHRGYEQKTISFRTNDIRGFVDVVQNPVIAASIKILRFWDLDFVAPAKKPSARTLRKGTRQGQRSAHVVLKEVDIMDVMAKMPNLQTVELDGLRSQSLGALLFPYGNGKDYDDAHAVGPSVTTLRVSNGELKSEELRSLLEAFGANLRKLELCRMVSQNGKWCDILRTVEAMQLGELRLDDLQSSEGLGSRKSVALDMLGGGRRVNKALRGIKGIEQYWIQAWMTGMAGESAVKAGLALILGRIGAR